MLLDECAEMLVKTSDNKTITVLCTFAGGLIGSAIASFFSYEEAKFIRRYDKTHYKLLSQLPRACAICSLGGLSGALLGFFVGVFPIIGGPIVAASVYQGERG